MVCDVTVQDRGLFSNYPYPAYITKELLELLGKIIKGPTNCYIDAAKVELRDVAIWRLSDRRFRDSAYDIILSRCTTTRSGSS